MLAESRRKAYFDQPCLHYILAFSIAALDPPSTVIKSMEMMLANFFWGQLDGKAKSHWIAWKNCCRPKEEGGIAVQSIRDLVRAYSYSLWSKFRKGGSLWAEYMRAR